MKILKSKLSLEKKRTQFLSIGLIVALSFTLVAFEWRSNYENNMNNARYEMEELEVEEVVYVKPIKKKKTKMIVTKKVKTKVFTTKFKVDDKPDDSKKKEEETKLNFDDFIVIDESEEALVTELIEKEYVKVERMPHFVECDEIIDAQALDNCTYKSLYKHIRNNLKINERITRSGSQKAYVSFLVNKKGEITSIEFLNDISKDLQKEIIRVLELTPDLIPGKQRGKAVNVRYKMPIKVTVR